MKLQIEIPVTNNKLIILMHISNHVVKVKGKKKTQLKLVVQVNFMDSIKFFDTFSVTSHASSTNDRP